MLRQTVAGSHPLCWRGDKRSGWWSASSTITPLHALCSSSPGVVPGLLLLLQGLPTLTVACHERISDIFSKKIFCHDCVNLQSDQWRQREHLPKTKKKVPQNSLAAAQPKEIFFQYYPHKMRFVSMYSECLQVVRIAFSSSFVVAYSFLCECKNFEESLNCCIWSGAIEEINCFNSAICKLVFFLTFLVVF